ncbi:hypothetical protein BJY52DRAFT_293564 [Lactarius psammicola]|nr:hypothetical protein BJY52DRAFT_293564 [Lactarius psammicola]
MSSSTPLAQLPPPPPPPPPGFRHIQTSVLGAGIAGLFVQGIESGLVIAQFSQWFSVPNRGESSVLSTIIVFVTVVGLAQSGVCFASAWTKYVTDFGMFPCPDWGDYVQSIPTLVMSAPVQALMIRRCYYLVSKNMFIITPLVLLLVASTVVSLWSTVLTLQSVALITTNDPVRLGQLSGIFWPYLMTILLPSVLDLALTGILLYHLTRTMKRVYAAHKRKRVFRLANIVWQSALPPTVCAICMCAMYIRFGIAPQKELQMWLSVVQAMVGKLYVLSLFYMVNTQSLQSDERPTTFISTLTVPMEVMYARTLDARAGDSACVATESGPARTVEFAV